MQEAQIRLHNVCKELRELYMQYGQRLVFGFHFSLHDHQNRLVDSFSLSNIQQTVLVQHYINSVRQTVQTMNEKDDQGALFTPGTKVVCIDDKNYSTHHTDPIPKYGRVLTVKDALRALLTSDVYLHFEEVQTSNVFLGYQANRFISYEAWISKKVKMQ